MQLGRQRGGQETHRHTDEQHERSDAREAACEAAEGQTRERVVVEHPIEPAAGKQGERREGGQNVGRQLRARQREGHDDDRGPQREEEPRVGGHPPEGRAARRGRGQERHEQGPGEEAANHDGHVVPEGLGMTDPGGREAVEVFTDEEEAGEVGMLERDEDEPRHRGGGEDEDRPGREQRAERTGVPAGAEEREPDQARQDERHRTLRQHAEARGDGGGERPDAPPGGASRLVDEDQRRGHAERQQHVDHEHLRQREVERARDQHGGRERRGSPAEQADAECMGQDDAADRRQCRRQPGGPLRRPEES